MNNRDRIELGKARQWKLAADGWRAASAEAALKTACTVGSLSCDALVRTAVSSAGVLEIARLLEMQACDKDQTPADAGLLMYCTEVLRQHAAAMTERQPPSNKECSQPATQ